MTWNPLQAHATTRTHGKRINAYMRERRDKKKKDGMLKKKLLRRRGGRRKKTQEREGDTHIKKSRFGARLRTYFSADGDRGEV